MLYDRPHRAETERGPMLQGAGAARAGATRKSDGESEGQGCSRWSHMMDRSSCYCQTRMLVSTWGERGCVNGVGVNRSGVIVLWCHVMSCQRCAHTAPAHNTHQSGNSKAGWGKGWERKECRWTDRDSCTTTQHTPERVGTECQLRANVARGVYKST